MTDQAVNVRLPEQYHRALTRIAAASNATAVGAKASTTSVARSLLMSALDALTEATCPTVGAAKPAPSQRAVAARPLGESREGTASPGVVRLNAVIAKLGLSDREVARRAGCKTHATVTRARSGKQALVGKLLAWVEEQETAMKGADGTAPTEGAT